jgi:hypothetical protein
MNMGGYDLHGNYYKSQRDAENAEMAQCAQISNDLQTTENQKLWQAIAMLEDRLQKLEQQEASDE